MRSLLTSCGRPDLLDRTLVSLYENQKYRIHTIVHEDGFTPEWIVNKFRKYEQPIELVYSGAYGQHISIEWFLDKERRLDKIYQSKYFLHNECDWLFNNSYDWIHASVKIMEQDENVIKVLARFESPHPCDHTETLSEGLKYGYLNPWTSPDGVEWCGFSFNPGVTRRDLLTKFIPFPKHEQELAKQIYDAGYKVVELSIPVYAHIGDGRSTHA